MNYKDLSLFFLSSLATSGVLAQQQKDINIILITADDLNCNSLGVYGCGVKGISPNIDRMANEGIRFKNAHVASAVSQPSRGALATGLYPHNSHIEGFYHTDRDIPAIVPMLREAGYYCGVLGKMDHSSPTATTPWNYAIDLDELGKGRDPRRYYSEIKGLIDSAATQNKPFYLMVNSHDPHRPWHGTKGEENLFKDSDIPQPSYIYSKDEIEIPGFLPDLPGVREEMTSYFNSVKRLDDCVGLILKALKDSGKEENTVIMFLSDNGISQPFSKTNCYFQSTNTPWIVYAPSIFSAQVVDDSHFISGIDFFPTVLDIIGEEIPSSLDGRSFKGILNGESDPTRTFVVTEFQSTSGKRSFPMRCLQDSEFAYIFNPWSIDSTKFVNESSGGLAFNEMRRYAELNKEVKERVDMNLYRVLEEFYDVKSDPNGLNNLIDHPAYQDEIDRYRALMLQHLKDSNDPLFKALEGRNDIATLRKETEKVQEYTLKRHKESPERIKAIK